MLYSPPYSSFPALSLLVAPIINLLIFCFLLQSSVSGVLGQNVTNMTTTEVTNSTTTTSFVETTTLLVETTTTSSVPTTSTTLETTVSPNSTTTTSTTTTVTPTVITSSTSTTLVETTTSLTAINMANFQAEVTLNTDLGFSIGGITNRLATLLGIPSNSLTLISSTPNTNSSNILYVIVQFNSTDDKDSLLGLAASQLETIGLMAAAPAPGSDDGATTASPGVATGTPSPNNNNNNGGDSNPSDNEGWVIGVAVSAAVVVVVIAALLIGYKVSEKSAAGAPGSGKVSFNEYMHIYDAEMHGVASGADREAQMRSMHQIESNARGQNQQL